MLFLIAVPTLAAGGGVLLFGRRGDVASGDHDGDAVSYVGGIVGALFTVVLAFYIVFAWQTGADVDSSATAEANGLLDAYWQADTLPEPQRTQLQALTRAYAKQVTDSEWEMLARNEPDPDVPVILDRLRSAVAALPVDGGLAQDVREAGLLDVRQVDEARRARVDAATTDDDFTTVLLVGTVLGAVIALGFPLLSGISAARPVHVVIMGALGLVLGLTLFVSFQLAQPVGGMFGAQPSAFLDAITEMARSGGSTS